MQSGVDEAAGEEREAKTGDATNEQAREAEEESLSIRFEITEDLDCFP
jgi:hypothetical protein